MTEKEKNQIEELLYMDKGELARRLLAATSGIKHIIAQYVPASDHRKVIQDLRTQVAHLK